MDNVDQKVVSAILVDFKVFRIDGLKSSPSTNFRSQIEIQWSNRKCWKRNSVGEYIKFWKIKGKKKLENNFLKKYAFISYWYKILSKFKRKIEFCDYFTYGLVL